MGKRIKSLNEKIITVNVLVFTTILILLFSLFFTYWLSSERKNNRESLRVIATVKANQLHDKLWSLDRIALQMANDPYLTNEVFRNLTDSPIDRNTFQNDRVLGQMVIEHILPFVLNKSVVSRICLFNERNDFSFVGDTVDYNKTRFYYRSSFFDSVSTNLERETARLLVFPREDPFYYETRLSEPDRVISLVRPIRVYGKQSFSGIAWVEVQQKVSEFEKMLSDLDNSIGYAIVGPNGVPLLEKGGLSGGHQDMQIAIPLDDFNLIFHLYKDNSYLTRMSYFLVFLLLISLALLILGMQRTERYIIHQLTAPLDELYQMVNSVSMENLDFDYKMEDEIDQISQLNLAFREVLLKLKDSINEKIEARTDELRSHLFALQAQMNPHFIHNTLAVISSLAEEANLNEIEDICSKLSQMIRYSSHYGMTNISLFQEVQHMENYLELMKIRYRDRVSYSISGRENSIQVSVVKFFLQPLVENCFTHGFKAVSPPWNIEIRVLINENTWEVEIKDNGVGFSLGLIKEIAKLRGDATMEKAENILKELQIGGMGLKNVFARFFLRYREKMIFKIENRTDISGGVVTVGGPC